MSEIFKRHSPEKIRISSEKLEKEQEVKEIDFANLKRGDKLTIETLLGKTIEKFKITITGKGKEGLAVNVRKKYGEEEEEFTARMPGGFTMHKEEGLTPGIIKIENEEEKNCLYFENLKDAKTKEKISSSMRTTPIKKIIFIGKERK